MYENKTNLELPTLLCFLLETLANIEKRLFENFIMKVSVCLFWTDFVKAF